MLDEIGRGTSTFDGISIAWAVAEHSARGGRAAAGAVRDALPRAHRPGTSARRACATPRSPCASGRATWCSCAASSRARRARATASRSPSSPACRRRSSNAPARFSTTSSATSSPTTVSRASPSTAKPAGGAQSGLFAGADDRLRDELAAIDVDRLAPVEALNRLHELVTRARRVNHRGPEEHRGSVPLCGGISRQGPCALAGDLRI